MTAETTVQSEKRPSSGLALSSMIIGIITALGGFMLIIPPILAVVFGHRSLSHCKKNPALGGRSMAITGLVTGYVGLLLMVLMVAAGVIGHFTAPRHASIPAAAEMHEARKIQSPTQPASLSEAEQPASRNHQEDIASALVGIASCVLILSFIIAIPGTIMGLNDNLVIYNGRQDVVRAFLLLFLFVATLVLAYQSVLWGVAAMLLTGIFVYWSIRESITANQTLARALIAVPTQIMLVFVFIITGLASIGSIATGLDDLKHDNKKAAAKNIGIGIAAAISAYLMKNLIKKLVKDRVAQLG